MTKPGSYDTSAPFNFQHFRFQLSAFSSRQLTPTVRCGLYANNQWHANQLLHRSSCHVGKVHKNALFPAEGDGSLAAECVGTHSGDEAAERDALTLTH